MVRLLAHGRFVPHPPITNHQPPTGPNEFLGTCLGTRRRHSPDSCGRQPCAAWTAQSSRDANRANEGESNRRARELRPRDEPARSSWELHTGEVIAPEADRGGYKIIVPARAERSSSCARSGSEAFEHQQHPHSLVGVAHVATRATTCASHSDERYADAADPPDTPHRSSALMLPRATTRTNFLGTAHRRATGTRSSPRPLQNHRPARAERSSSCARSGSEAFDASEASA